MNLALKSCTPLLTLLITTFVPTSYIPFSLCVSLSLSAAPYGFRYVPFFWSHTESDTHFAFFLSHSPHLYRCYLSLNRHRLDSGTWMNAMPFLVSFTIGNPPRLIRLLIDLWFFGSDFFLFGIPLIQLGCGVSI